MTQTIMVINDTQDILELFQEILTDEGYAVVVSSYTPRDLEYVEQVQPDLLILDYIFGQPREGWQLLQKLKMRRATATIPIIVCTTATREVREIEGELRAKGVIVVPKPFEIDELLHAVTQALSTPQSTASLMIQPDEEEPS